MKTKRTEAVKVGNLPGFHESAEETARKESPAETETPSNGNKQRFNLSFDLMDDGSPDFSSMRGKTKDKLREFFANPKIASEFGTKTTAVEVQIFHPAMVSGLYDMLGTLEAVAAQRWGKIPEHVANKVFTYTPAEKDALSGPTIRVLNKYAAEWMIKYQDEIALATLLISVTAAKVNAAILLSRMQPGSQAKSEENVRRG